MTDFDLPAIAADLNAKASSHPIGQLQEIRKKLKKLERRPGKDIFRLQGRSKTVFPDWGFHYGGRTELQFNIGKDGSGGTMLRHGVAFSFETSQTLPSIVVLESKVRLFNEFLQLYPEKYATMRMWHFEDGARIGEYMPGPIPPERVKEGVFVFLGKRLQIDQLNYELILNDFDDLLPLYQYVESCGELQPISMPTQEAFSFRPGCSVKAQATVATLAQNQLDVTLRHNVLQEVLYQRLASQFGADNVGTELASGVGTSVDLVVRLPEGYWYYEIKTAHSPRACIREALGQLLEYAFWPGAQEASRLTVVGESSLDQDGEEYLRQLRTRFSLPIHYEQITV
jgi:hypothetical protein